MYIGLYVKYRYCCQILMKLEFYRQIFEKYSKILNFMKIRLVGAELFCADGRRDTTKRIVAFRNSANSPKKLCHHIRPSLCEPNCLTDFHEIWYWSSLQEVIKQAFRENRLTDSRTLLRNRK